MSSATINGRTEILPADADALLVDVLRDQLHLTGTKLVCGAGVCGACTVLLDGVPVVSCLLPAKAAAGKSITTVEGIGAPGLHPVQKAFMALDALQCGFCTPGFIVEATAFHDLWRAAHGPATPSRDVIGAALSGHLCRCSAYDNIFRAVSEACAGRYDGDAVASPRVEARDKVTGAAKYTVDIRHDGQLEGLVLRSSTLQPPKVQPRKSTLVQLVVSDATLDIVLSNLRADAEKQPRRAMAFTRRMAPSAPNELPFKYRTTPNNTETLESES